MVDKITKTLRKLSSKDKKKIKKILIKIKNHEFNSYDCKKLKGQYDIYRIRTGKFRIIFQIKDDKIKILTLGKTKDDTYRKF